MKVFSTKLGAAVFVAILTMIPTAAFATEIVGGGTTGSLTWELDSDGVLTISGTDAMPNWFPQPMNRPPWYATHAADIKKAVISDGVTNIGSFAFAESALESVTFPNSLSFTTIGDAAFYSTKLTSVTIPASVTTIEDRAFNSNTLPQSAIFKGNPPTTVTPASNAQRSFPNTNFTIYYQPANEDAWLAASSGGLWNGYPIVPDPAAADNDAITIAKGLVENMQFTASQATVTNITEAKAEVETSIATLSLDDVIATVIDGEFTAAVAGTHLNLDGTGGSYTFTVKLEKGIGIPQITSTLTLTITATPAETYAITVTGGEVTAISNSASVAEAAAGATVEVTADPPTDGYTFAKWTTASDGVTFAGDGDETTTFEMPANAVTVTAEWVCTHSWAWQTVSAATCVLSGSRRQVCSRCEAVGSSEIIAALGHAWDWNITLAPSCEAAGSRTQICAVCEAEGETESIPQLTENCGGTSIRDVQEKGYALFKESVVSDKMQIMLPDEERLVNFTVLDALGNLVHNSECGNAVATQRGEPQAAIRNAECVWNLKNSAGRYVANGSYLVIVEAIDKNGKTKRYSGKIGVKR